MTVADDAPDGMTNQIASIFSGIAGLMREEAVEAYQKVEEDPEISKAADALRLMDCIGFSDAARRRLKPIKGLLLSKLSADDRTEFLFMHASFVETHLERIIEEVEGSSAYVDKARHVLRRAASASALGIRVNLGADDPDAYWLPKKVFRTHEEIMSFVDALHSLYYGDADDFIEQSLKIRMIHGRGFAVAALLQKLLPSAGDA
ncbi:hypothetical protein [Rhizobium leguminosarum]|uniref:hypothetical protein n=1 Tax=Rhizobium leguminosarum TaxID=384 RepID=UPI002E0E85E7|nr:hypothetical protein U8Q02_36970 [Rhizobium leguminosarum]